MLILSPRWLAVALLTFTVTAARAEGPLVVKAPEGWTVSYKGNAQRYVVSEEEGKMPQLMLGPISFITDAALIPDYITFMSHLFIKASKENAEFADMNPNYVVDKIQGQAFSGEAAVFTLKNIVQTLFMVSDGRGNWNGQFTGSAEDWQKAKGVLEGMQRSP